MKKRAFLIGGYQKAQALAEDLKEKKFHVTIINENYNDCLELAEIDNVDVIRGDGSRLYVLDDAGIEGADLAIALTRRDEDNLVICELCKKRFNVKKTTALVNDPRKVDFFSKMGVDSVVCPVTAVTRIIERRTFDESVL